MHTQNETFQLWLEALNNLEIVLFFTLRFERTVITAAPHTEPLELEGALPCHECSFVKAVSMQQNLLILEFHSVVASNMTAALYDMCSFKSIRFVSHAHNNL